MKQLNESNAEVRAAIMESDKVPAIDNTYKAQVTECLIDNSLDELKMNESADSTSNTGGMAKHDSLLMGIVRRGVPQLLAFDIVGVQPMSTPSSMVYALRPRYDSQTGGQAFMDEPNSAHSGTGTHAGDTSGFAQDEFAVGTPAAATDKGTGMSTAAGEALGSESGGTWKQMGISIEKTTVEAKTRALKAEFTRELEQDARAVHGIDITSELATVLATELTAEVDRELLRTVNIAAALADKKLFDLDADADGRWLVEKHKALLFQIDLVANEVGKATRRGRANIIVASANVVSALAMTNQLEYNPQMATNLDSDITGATFAGVLMGKYKVYIDPYASIDYVTVGYKGASAWDAGVFYCPYVPLQMHRATGENNFQPKIGFTQRSGIIANPFAALDATGNAKAGKGLAQGENPYYRKFKVTNIV